MNAYFQLITSSDSTYIKLFPPTDGGANINVTELTEYLRSKNIDVMDLKAIYQAMLNLDKPLVLPLSPVGRGAERECFSLKVSEDKMTAVARFYPPSNAGALIAGKEEIIDDLRFRKVTFGYDMEEIERFLADRRYCEDIVVARGVEAVQGKDARIEYNFNTDLSMKPARNPDGSVDFFHLDTINHCKKGDVLARLYREVEGKPGKNVYGELIAPRTVKRLMLKFGRNIQLSEDGCSISSQLDGHVLLEEDRVFVSEVYEVEDVGPATGNVESNGSVLVRGNVQTGFSVKAKGNVEVRGVVEGANIETDGDIIIARGMNGMGKGVLKAGGSVILKYAENATIEAGTFVESDSILHSRVNAKTEVNVDGRKGFIVGGAIRATEKIKCKTLGSPMGASTLVEVGIDPEQKVRMQELQKEITATTKNLHNIQSVLIEATQRLKKGEKFPAERMKYIQSLAVTNKQLTEQLEENQKELSSLEELMQGQSAACICVSDEAFGGTTISIGDVSMVLKSSISYCRFIRDKGSIKSVPY